MMALNIENQARQGPCFQGAFTPEEPGDTLIWYHRKCSKFSNRGNPEGHGSTIEGHLNQKEQRRSFGGRFPWTELFLRTLQGEAIA